MLRSCQMLLGNAMVRHLGSGRREDVVRWFADAPGEVAVYSIHNMVKVGMRYDVLPGEWYGPGVAAHVLRDLCEAQSEVALRVTVTSAEKPLCREAVLDEMTRAVDERVDDSAVVDDSGEYDPLLRPPPSGESARREARRQRLEEAEWDESLLLVVPVRLGLHKLEDKFVAPLLACLAFPQSVGMVGGRPRQALYFPGRRGADLVGLDPHVVQPSPGLGPGLKSPKYLDSLRCRSPRFLDPTAIDPSLALAFYCHTKLDFADFLRRARALAALSQPPIFDVLDTLTTARTLDFDDDDDLPASSRPDDDDDDDYVVV